MLLFSIVACESTEEVDIEKYPIVITAKEISETYGLKLDLSGNSEKSTLTDFGDGSKELEYEYELIDSDEFAPLYMVVEVVYGINIVEAMLKFEMGKSSVLDAAQPNQEFIEVTDLDIPGSDVYYCLVYGDGKNKGAFLLVRELHRLYSCMIVGIKMEDHQLIKELIIPKLETLLTADL